MNVTEFAEQIVFGTTLEEKLLSPGKLSPSIQGLPNTDRLATPGRPHGLAMHDGPGVSQPPSDSELGNEKARGRLLHFLANHELLATELMALVLLKFPDAPHAFKRGVLVTLQEEQEHTRLYLDRMQACGVEFGSFPLSGHFWRVVEPMQSPMDFVSRLSLTFEQANLDYSQHFAKVFRQLGDFDTANILERIYQDEIGHVQHGLHWFRQWKDPQHSDWEAYSQALEFPMSPQKGRGPICSFNREGRKLAGLSEDFIDAIEVFRQSRGRPPTVRWFDSAAEAELNGQLSDKEEQLLHQLAVDLEGVMIALARQDDVQLVRRLPSIAFRKQLLDAGIEPPEFVDFDDVAALSQRKLQDLSPWAWTPQSHRVAAPLMPVAKQRPPEWRNEHAELFRKSWSAENLHNWLDSGHNKCPEWFIAEPRSTCVADTEQVEAVLDELGSVGHATALFKQDLATSGRGQRRLACGPLNESDQSWLRSMWKNSQSGVLEPEWKRVLDLSFLWGEPTPNGPPKFLGWTRPLVAAGRRYMGTRLSRPFDDCDSELKRFLLANDCGRLRSVREWLEQHLVTQLENCGFRYSFGVDAMVCRDQRGQLKIHPLVELNPRLTMGHVALALRKYIAPVVEAEFRVFTRSEWEQVAQDLEELPLKRSGDGRWVSGLVKFCEIDERTKLVPVVLVGDALRC